MRDMRQPGTGEKRDMVVNKGEQSQSKVKLGNRSESSHRDKEYLARKSRI